MSGPRPASGARIERPNLGRVGFHGRLEFARVESALLQGNALGDPHVRELPVYLPPGWDGGTGFPCLWLLAGFTGRGHKYAEPAPFAPSVAQRFDALVAAGDAPPAILAMPDCMTSLGGSQYVDSSATGPYASHVVRELVPLVESAYPVAPGAHVVLGKSSGGFGALHLTAHFPGVFRGAASVSGDCCFELCYGHELLAGLTALVPFEFDAARFLADVRARPRMDTATHAALNTLAMAACYSPNPAAPLGLELPIDLTTGERIEAVWRRWLEFDPLESAARHAHNWRALDWLYLECGLADEYHLQWGLRRLVRRLTELKVPHEHAEHPGGHRGIDGRLLELLPRAARLASGRPV